MAIHSKFFSEMFYKGGFLTVGAACILLNKADYLPRSTLPISCGLFATGIMGIILSCKKFFEDDDPDYEARMQEFYRLKPQLEKHIQEHVILNMEYLRMRRIMQVVDDMEKESREYEEIISAYQLRRAARTGAEEIEFRRPVLDNDDGSRKKRYSLQLEDVKKFTKFYCVF